MKKASLQLLLTSATQKQTSTQNYINAQQQSFASTYIKTFTLNCFILQVKVHTQGLGFFSFYVPFLSLPSATCFSDVALLTTNEVKMMFGSCTQPPAL